MAALTKITFQRLYFYTCSNAYNVGHKRLA